MKYSFAVVLATVLAGMPVSQAFAVCAGPVGVAGEIIYNSDHKVMQFCNDTDWMAMGGGGANANGGQGAVQIGDGAGDLTSSTHFIFDTVNQRLGVGMANPHHVLDVNGTIVGGDVTSTGGSLLLANRYVDAPINLINTWGGHYSSAASYMGYAVRAKPGAAGYVSSADNVSWPRSALEISDWFRFKSLTTTVAARGADVVMPDRLVVNPSGNVGIGTSLPQVLLEVNGSIGFTYSTEGSSHSGMRRNSYWTEYYNAITSTPSADIHVFTGNGGVQKFVIKEGGDVYVAANAFKPGGGAWVATSDARLKTVDRPYDNGLEQIKALSPVWFHYNEGNARKEPADKAYVGLVAQDVKAVMPEAVTLGDDGYYNLDVTPIHYAYINAIKSLSAQNDALKAELDMVKARLDALERH